MQTKANSNGGQKLPTASSTLPLRIAVAVLLIVVLYIWPHLSKPDRFENEQTALSHAIVLLGTSKSDRDSLSNYVTEIGDLQAAVPVDTTWLTVLRFDSNVREVYSNKVPPSRKALYEALVPGLTPTSRTPGTNFEAALSRAADLAEESRGTVVLLVQTDGYSEGATRHDQALLKIAATRIAKNEKVKTVFIEGVDPLCRAQLRKDLEALKPKLQLVERNQLDAHLIANLLAGGAK